MKKIRRINLFGGPGSGKSVLACYIRAELAFKGYNIELISEAIKEWTFIPRIPKGCDGFYLLANQIQQEDIRLRAGVDIIVSDSPVFLQYFYAQHHNVPLQNAALVAALGYEELYASICIMLQRKDRFYNSLGRYETLEQAKAIDENMKEMLEYHGINYVEFPCAQEDKIVDYLITQLEAE